MSSKKAAAPRVASDIPTKRTIKRRLVQSRVDAEIIGRLVAASVDIPELIRRACRRAADRIITN